MPPASPTTQLSHLATLESSSHSRAWLTAPHPALPLLATCSSDKTVRIYSLTTFTLLSTISGGHKRSIRTCAWKPNLKGESVLATGSFDASVGIWRHYDNDMTPKAKDVITPVDFDARDRAIENGDMGGGGGEEEEEEEDEWRFAIVLDGHESEVKSVAWSAGGNFLATCSRDKSVWIWEDVGGGGGGDEDEYETVAVMQEHQGDVKCVSWHPEEEMVASASYDDEIRLWREDVDDWGCCAVLRGHGGTVWCVAWEPKVARIFAADGGEKDEGWVKRREAAGPRLLSCSDDGSVRVWRRRPREKRVQNRLSIIRSGSSEEEWIEEAKLPEVHTRSIYAVAWGKGGRVVSTGGDGAVVVYEERWRKATNSREGEGKDGEAHNKDEVEEQVVVNGKSKPDEAGNKKEGATKDAAGSTTKADTQAQEKEQHSEVEDVPEARATEWVIVAQMEGAHGVFEVNHVAWAPRRDRNGGEDGELIVTTGDDGTVKVWRLDL